MDDRIVRGVTVTAGCAVLAGVANAAFTYKSGIDLPSLKSAFGVGMAGMTGVMNAALNGYMYHETAKGSAIVSIAAASIGTAAAFKYFV